MGIRHEVADALAAGLASAYTSVGKGWQVYPEEPKAFSAPCVIISPRSPYRIRETYTEIRTNLQLTVVLPIGSNLDRIDTVLDVLTNSLPDGTAWQQADYTGTAGEGVDYLTAAIDVVAAG